MITATIPRKHQNMKPFHLLLNSARLAILLTLTACNRSNDQKITPQSIPSISVSQPVPGSSSNLSYEESQQKSIANLSDARLYCLGMMLYAEKHGNQLPTNLDQTLPYLEAPNRPGSTNHFE